MYEIYHAIIGRKTYVVCSGTMMETFKAADRHYRINKDYIRVRNAWIINDELYFENPHKKGQKKVWAAYTNRGDAQC